jgi:hypothetical protein
MAQFYLKPISGKQKVTSRNNVLECGNNFNSILRVVDRYLVRNDELVVIQPSFLSLSELEEEEVFHRASQKGVLIKWGSKTPCQLDVSSSSCSPNLNNDALVRLKNEQQKSNLEISQYLGVSETEVTKSFEKIKEECLSGRDPRVSDMFEDYEV